MGKQQLSYEVRSDGDVVGPVSVDQIRRGVAAGRIPPGSQARQVSPWAPVMFVPMLEAPPGRDKKPCVEIKHGKDIRGPVSLYQVRRGLAEALIPDGSQARIVWPWIQVERLLGGG